MDTDDAAADPAVGGAADLSGDYDFKTDFVAVGDEDDE